MNNSMINARERPKSAPRCVSLHDLRENADRARAAQNRVKIRNQSGVYERYVEQNPWYRGKVLEVDDEIYRKYLRSAL